MSDDFGLLTDKERAFVDSYTEKIRKEERERILSYIKKEVLHYAHFSWLTLIDPPYVYLGDIDVIIDTLLGEEN